MMVRKNVEIKGMFHSGVQTDQLAAEDVEGNGNDFLVQDADPVYGFDENCCFFGGVESFHGIER